MKQKQGFRQYMVLTFLIGFGFFTMGLMDPLYDTYVPIFLNSYIDSKALIGLVMTLDNILQLLLIPIVAVWSDRTRTKIGRRMPFIIVMLPLSALLFSLIPPMAAISLTSLIIIIFLFNIFKTSVRGPVVALMPDTIPGEYRSEANGVINTMGGIGLIVGTLALAQLMKFNKNLPFAVAGLFVLGATGILFLFVREKNQYQEETEKTLSVWKSVRMVFSGKERSVIRILLSLFFWFMAYEGAKPFLGLYLVDVMGVSSSNAALAQGVAGIASVVMAIPSGYLAHKLGRRNFIRLSLTGLALVLLLVPTTGLISNGLHLPAGGSLLIFL
ncbi:MAG: MFS transporter, partial [Termitinemataceae bacterium]